MLWVQFINQHDAQECLANIADNDSNNVVVFSGQGYCVSHNVWSSMCGWGSDNKLPIMNT